MPNHPTVPGVRDAGARRNIDEEEPVGLEDALRNFSPEPPTAASTPLGTEPPKPPKPPAPAKEPPDPSAVLAGEEAEAARQAETAPARTEPLEVKYLPTQEDPELTKLLDSDPMFRTIYSMISAPGSDLLGGVNAAGQQNTAAFTKAITDIISGQPKSPDGLWDDKKPPSKAEVDSGRAPYWATDAQGNVVANDIKRAQVWTDYGNTFATWAQSASTVIAVQMNAASSRFSTVMSFLDSALGRRSAVAREGAERAGKAAESALERQARAVEAGKQRQHEITTISQAFTNQQAIEDIRNKFALGQIAESDKLATERVKLEQGFISARAGLDRAVAQGQLDEIVRANKRQETLAESRLNLDTKIAENNFLLGLLASGGMSLQTLAQASGQSPADVLRGRGVETAPGATGQTPLSLSGPPTAGQLASMSPQQRAALAAQFGGPDELARRAEGATPLEAQTPQRGRV